MSSSTTPFDFYLDWIVCAQFAGLCWAVEKGLYEEARLDVKLIPWAHDGRSVIDKVNQAAASGSLCAGSCEDNLIVGRIAQDHSIKAFGAMLQEPPLALMSHPDSLITRFTDLRGKRIAMHADGIIVLKTVLALEGIDASEVDIREVGFDLDHLISRSFDAVQGYRMTEPIQLAELGVNVSLLPIAHHRLKPYAQVYFASARQLDENEKQFALFRSASDAGWRAVLNNPDEAAHVVARTMGDVALADQQRKMIECLSQLIVGAQLDDKVGSIDAEQWQRNLATYAEFGITDRPLTFDEAAFTLP